MIAHVAVVIPAADEQDTISACLDAVLASVRHLDGSGMAITADVVVVLDGCTDGTEDRVRGIAGVHPVRTGARCVGVARALGCRIATARAPVAPTRVWLANTDADSAVPAQWLAAQLAHADAGADVVLGTVEPVGLAEPFASVWRSAHTDRTGHGHVHGANFGIRASLLRDLGGWPPVAAGEDVLLASRAGAAGAAVVYAGGLTVATSPRRNGRVAHGFSTYLAAL